MKRTVLFLGRALALALLAHAVPASAELPPLIRREVLFGNPQRTSPKISPDGRRLAWLAPDSKDVLQVFVRTIGQADDKAVTADKRRGIRAYQWAPDNRTLLYLQDADGDENWHIYGVDLPSGNVRDYTPLAGVQARFVALEPGIPDQILVALNLQRRELHDVYRLTLSTGALVLDTENPGDVQEFHADSQLRVRAAEVATPDGGHEVRLRRDVKAPWRSLVKVGPEEILGFVDFSLDGKSVYLESSVGADTARLVQRDLDRGAEKILAADKDVDVGAVIVHPRRHVPQAVAFSPERQRWTVIDPAVRDDFAGIARLNPGDFGIINRDDRDATWLVGFTQDRGPIQFYAWDRAAKKGTFLFSQQPALEGLTLGEMRPVTLPARDGLPLHGYLTLPPGVPQKDLPLVLMVHGGPWSRDRWGYHSYAQFYANRGYACLQVNFRGSTGYGKRFWNAGNREWGKKMHDDLLDAVAWAVKQGYADPRRVAIMGGSYGGYAALAGLSFTPTTFACGVDLVGPSSIATLLRSIPPYWKTMLAEFHTRVGNPDDPKDAELIRAASPLFAADKIVRPLLIGQGANDPRVKQAESEQIVAAIRKRGGAVTYVVYGDEGHGFARPDNRLDFSARIEAFLKPCLGGRAEPAPAERYPGSSATVK